MHSAKTIILSGLFILITAGTAGAISGAGAIVLEFNTSARAEGMGGAGVAVPWGGETNNWANPALLAFRPGLRYDRLESKLVPDLADDILLNNDQITFGAYGLGILYAQVPLGGAYLDMGDQLATSDDGTEGVPFNSWMRSRSHGVGVNLTQILAALGGDATPDLLQRLDIAGGIVWKEIEDMLAPDHVLQDQQGGSGRADCYDLGLLAAYQFMDSRGREDGPFASLGGLMLAASAGLSTLNAGNNFIVHVDADQADPLPKMHVQGWALHLETGLPDAMRPMLESSGPAWLADVLTPFVSITYSKQRIQPGITWVDAEDEYVYERDTSDDKTEKGWGVEVSIVNIFHLRRGHYTGTGQIDGDTSGWGVHLPLGPFGGLRYDRATVPQATGLVDVTRESAGIWVDGLAILDQL